MSNNTFYSDITVQELWSEARKFELSLSRPTSTTATLTVKNPASTVIDGCIILLSTSVITPNNYPVNGKQYAPDLVFGDGDSIAGAFVVASYHGVFQNPIPTGIVEDSTSKNVWSITVTGLTANTIYYASIYPCSNTLQYYSLGISANVLENTKFSNLASSYTGSIPHLQTAPASPTNGFTYFDESLGLVQYWDNTRSIWIPSRADSIFSGTKNPGIPGHVYYSTGQGSLLCFANGKWNRIDTSNLQLKDSTSNWVPFTSYSANTTVPPSPLTGELFYNYTTQTISYFNDVDWVYPDSSTSLFNPGTGPIPAFSVSFTVEPVDLPSPSIGFLFYNTLRGVLNVFTGTSWIQVNTDQQGTASSDKIGIGNDGSHDERIQLISILKAQLGWPAICVELAEEQFSIGIDNALDTYRQLSVGAYEKRFIIMSVIPNQPTYYLNSPTDGTNRIVSVQKIHRLNMFGVNSITSDSNLYLQSFLTEMYNYGKTDLLSIHLMHSLNEEYTRIFAGDIMFTWNEARRELNLQRVLSKPERIILEVELERSEQELLLDRYCKQFIQNWAIAECKETLGMIRSKYSSGTPGVNGSMTFNGEMLLSEARQDFTELKEALLNYEYQNADHGNVSFFIG